MTQPRSKYDYPGLPLWDRDGNPVGVGDVVRNPVTGVECKIYHIGNSPCVGRKLGESGQAFTKTTPGLKTDNWTLVMPPGFPKDRRFWSNGNTFRFVDEWHAYWLTGDAKGEAERACAPCSDTSFWFCDGDGNPVQPEANEVQRDEMAEIRRRLDELERKHKELSGVSDRRHDNLSREIAEANRRQLLSATKAGGGLEQEVRRLDAVLQSRSAEWDALMERVEGDEAILQRVQERLDELSRTVEGVKTQVGQHQGWIDASIPETFKQGMAARAEGRTVDLETALTEPPPAPLPTDPDEWEECEAEPYDHWPKYRRCDEDNPEDTVVVRFKAHSTGVVVAAKDPAAISDDPQGFTSIREEGCWTPVRPRRREVEPDPDRELRDWFWERRDKLQVTQGSRSWCVSLNGKRVCLRGTFDDALRSLRRMVQEAERSGQEKGGAE